jgi:hypothetical protein
VAEKTRGVGEERVGGRYFELMGRLIATLVSVGAACVAIASPASASAAGGVLVGRASGAHLTARELRHARPLELPAPSRAPAGPVVLPHYGGSQPAFPIDSEGYWPRKHYYSTVGRLYARISATTVGACTATVVARSIVVTAAHCLVNYTTGRFYSAFVFIPAQYGATAPEGRWTGAHAYVWKAFVKHPFESVDYGFLTIHPKNGRNIGGVTGWEGILANSPVRRIRSFGYPGGGMFADRCDLSSCYQWTCNSPLGERILDPTGAFEIGMGCHGEEGSSGGPWFEVYKCRRYVASNVSTGVRNPGAGHDINEWGPYYDQQTLRLLGDAKRRA